MPCNAGSRPRLRCGSSARRLPGLALPSLCVSARHCLVLRSEGPRGPSGCPSASPHTRRQRLSPSGCLVCFASQCGPCASTVPLLIPLSPLPPPCPGSLFFCSLRHHARDMWLWIRHFSVCRLHHQGRQAVRVADQRAVQQRRHHQGPRSRRGRGMAKHDSGECAVRSLAAPEPSR